MNTAGHKRPAYLLYRTLWQALDWIFPPLCGGGCGKMGIRWCTTCSNQVSKIEGTLCERCGEPISSGIGSTCQECLTTPPDYQVLRSCTWFKGTIREALHQLKYQKNIGMGDSLSEHLVEYYNELQWDFDFVTVVPLSNERLRERGYNQTSFLARPFAYAIDKPYLPKTLKRKRNTPSQVGLNAEERHQNVKDAFVADQRFVNGKTVLLIDDVATTGATISACAKALRQAGASAVFGLTLSRAMPQADADDQPTTSHNNGGKYGSRGRDLS